eukprot:scaffold52997_cov35-Tisochrysis_lutea.AAC.3
MARTSGDCLEGGLVSAPESEDLVQPVVPLPPCGQPDKLVAASTKRACSVLAALLAHFGGGSIVGDG